MHMAVINSLLYILYWSRNMGQSSSWWIQFWYVSHLMLQHVFLNKYFHNSDGNIPGLVTNARSVATPSSIKISWSAPSTSSDLGLSVDQYFVQYSFNSSTLLKETKETYFELSHLSPSTFVLFTIRASFQGRIGPGMFIAQSTGKFD